MDEKISLYRGIQSVVVVCHSKNERPYIDVPHLHSQYEIYYNIDGAKGFFVDKKFYKCTGSDLFIVPKTCVHKVIVNKGTVYERCIINIDSKIIDSINAAPHLNSPLFWLDGAGNIVVQKVNFTYEEHCKFMNLIAEYNRPENNELKRYADLMEILAFISFFFKVGRIDTNAVKPPESVTEKALIIIEEHFKDIKVSEIAERLYVNDSYLSKIFKDEFGITLTNYLIVRKIAEAKKFLYMGMSVKKACILSGFHNYSNFIRTFKNFEGCSPGSFEELSDPL